MNLFDRAFDELYACQTRTLGVAIKATVTGYAENKPALLSTVNDDDGAVMGGIGQAGGYTLQMKVSDFPKAPEHDTLVTVNGDAAGERLVITSYERASGIYNLKVGDPQYG